MRTKRIVVVLGGGGAKAAAHVGAGRALAEAGLPPIHYVGTSMGAVVAAMFARGQSHESVLEQLSSVQTRDVVVADRLAVVKGLYLNSVLKPGPLRATLRRLVPVERFTDLKVPLTIVVTDIESGELVLFGTGGRDAPLQDALYATCALPVFYPPAELEGRRYVDGGLRAILPIEVATGFSPELLIAVDVGPGFDEGPKPEGRELPPIVQAHNDAEGVLMAAQSQASLALWRATSGRPPLVYIRPHLPRGATFRVDLLQRFAEEGYRAAKEALAQGPR